jgi:hypothetical protein
MARLTVDLELEQIRAIVRDLDSTLDPVGIARLHGDVSDVYRIDVAGSKTRSYSRFILTSLRGSWRRRP